MYRLTSCPSGGAAIDEKCYWIPAFTGMTCFIQSLHLIGCHPRESGDPFLIVTKVWHMEGHALSWPYSMCGRDGARPSL